MVEQHKRPAVPGQRPSVGNGISQKTDEQPKLSIEQLQDKVAVVVFPFVPVIPTNFNFEDGS